MERANRKTMMHPYVQNFRKMYPGVPEQTLTSTATRFQSAIIEYENCSSCKEMQFNKSLSEYDKLVYRLNNCPNAKKVNDLIFVVMNPIV